MIQPLQKKCTSDVHFLIGSDEVWCEEALHAIKNQNIADPHGITSWRSRHGLVRACTPENLHPQLQALHKAGNITVLHFWVALTSDAWDARSTSAQQWMHDQQEISLISSEFERWSKPVLGALGQPDASSQLPWLLAGRLDPVPASLLRLAPLPDQTADESESMRSKGHQVFQSWASAFLNNHSPDYLESVYGPFPDKTTSDQDGEIENDSSPTKSGNVVPIVSANSKSTSKYSGSSPFARPSVRLAASSALSASDNSGSHTTGLPVWKILSRRLKISVSLNQDGTQIQFVTEGVMPSPMPLQLQLMPRGEPPRLIKVPCAVGGNKSVRASEILITEVKDAKAWLEGARLALRYPISNPNGTDENGYAVLIADQL